MAYTASLDRSKAIKTIFLRPGDNLIADEFDYSSAGAEVDLSIFPGECLDLVNQDKFYSGDGSNKGGYYEPRVANFDYYAGKTVLDEWTTLSFIPTRLCTPGTLVALRVGPGTASNYAKGVELVNQAGTTSASIVGLTFNSGTLVVSTVCHFIVEEAPSATISTFGLIVARCIPPKILKDVA